MAKYDPLTAHLAAVPDEEAQVAMRFGDVDRLVGGLPASARAHRPWWANSSHVQARAWRAAGWHVQDVDLAEGKVVFARGSVGGSYAARRAAGISPSGESSATEEELVLESVVDDELGGAVVDLSPDLIPGLDRLAQWSEWVPFDGAVKSAPRLPGVYLARAGSSGPLVYVGMAGERRGRGVRGRLEIYGRGRGAVSGLGEACLDRALADTEWLVERLAEVRDGSPHRAKEWARLAVQRADLHIRYAITGDAPAARALERAVLDRLAGASIWNRAR
jgi:hypothetical protein